MYGLIFADGPINFDSSHYSTNILRQETPEVSDLGLPTPQNSPPSNIWDVKLFRCISEHQSKLNPTSTRKPKDPELLMLLDPSDSHTSEDSLTRFLYPPISQWNYQLPEKLAIFWLNYIHLEVSLSNCHNLAQFCKLSNPLVLKSSNSMSSVPCLPNSRQS